MILVTGATGKVGRRVAHLLAAQGARLRLSMRDRARAPEIPGAERVAAPYEDREALRRAFQGARVALLVSAYGKPGDRARLHANVIDEAASARVERIVYLSFQGAAPSSAFPYARDHAETEQHLRESGLAFTILRDNLYQDSLARYAGPERVIRGPGGNGRAAWVAREDVAQVVARVLLDEQHVSRCYDVTGPEALSFAEAAEELSRLSGHPVRYEDETVEEGRRRRMADGAQEWEAETWMGSYRAVAAGELEPVSDAVLRLTGRPPFTLRSYYTQFPELLAPLGG